MRGGEEISREWECGEGRLCRLRDARREGRAYKGDFLQGKSPRNPQEAISRLQAQKLFALLRPPERARAPQPQVCRRLTARTPDPYQCAKNMCSYLTCEQAAKTVKMAQAEVALRLGEVGVEAENSLAKPDNRSSGEGMGCDRGTVRAVLDAAPNTVPPCLPCSAAPSSQETLAFSACVNFWP